MIPARVELQIDELVLEGLDGIDAQAVGTVVRLELARLLAERGTPVGWRQGGMVDGVDGGAFTRLPADTAESVGAHIAHAIHGGLSR